jgi:hypothetical protein
LALWSDFDADPPGPPAGAGERSLVSSPAAWAVLLAVYVALGMVLKSTVLNWIVGPLFPLVFLYLVPRFLRSRPTT